MLLGVGLVSDARVGAASAGSGTGIRQDDGTALDLLLWRRLQGTPTEGPRKRSEAQQKLAASFCPI